jgi:hypothetical protein
MTNIPYKSFCWSLGTTSFRTRNFNKTIEEQLALLTDFWSLTENSRENWSGNSILQERYYNFMQSNGFVEGDAGNKPKDAREKTSGLVDIGLIDDGRKLTEAGLELMRISKSNDFSSDNLFQIPKDSYIYLKQLLKTYYNISGDIVRPFIVLLHILSKLGHLSLEEYTFLLPLCTNPLNTSNIIRDIIITRHGGNLTVDTIIINRLMEMDNYASALNLLLTQNVSESLLCEIGLNRKSREYDKVYFPLYNALHSVFVDNNTNDLYEVYNATNEVKIGKWWRNYLFNTTSKNAIKNNPGSTKNRTMFDDVNSENSFRETFFKVMHLFKAKATLSDYLDLNKRYIKTSDIILFEDNTIKLDMVPKQFFSSVAEELYTIAYQKSELLFKNCNLEDIYANLVIDVSTIIEGINAELGTNITTVDEAQHIVEDLRYERLQRLIENKFSDDNLLTLLNCFENRQDNEIRNMVTDNADVPTIFEYVLGILWYKASDRQGKILDYMKLSLDADLLPITHAIGGEADILYEYPETEHYPAHSLLLEATLADSGNQRRMEMEPVSRHLGSNLIRTGNLNSYCVFATNFLHINVISDFRSRKSYPYYDPQDYTKSVQGMKIIPLQTSELKKIVANNKKYKDLYSVMEQGYQSTLPPHEWYADFSSKI